MRAAQLQTPASRHGQSPTVVSPLPQLQPADPAASASTPARQQPGEPAYKLPALQQPPPPAARILTFGSPSPTAAPPAMAVSDQQLELSEDALFQDDQDGLQDAAVDTMSSDSEGAAEPAPLARVSPPAAAAEADSSDSSDEEIGDEFAAAAELHRSASSGALTGSQPHASPIAAAAPSTPGSAGGGFGTPTPGESAPRSAERLIPTPGSGDPAAARRPAATIPTPVSSRKKLAVEPAASKLGTSVPIAIPMGLRDEHDSTPESPDEPGGIHASTFVPPHMLETRSGALDLTNSVQGTSPAASLKRERLQNRNAILRRTGFLEAGANGAAFLDVLDPIREATFEAPPTPAPAPAAVPGALSRALGPPRDGGSSV